MIRSGSLAATIFFILNAGMATAAPTYLECRNDDSENLASYRVATIMADPDGFSMDQFWITLTYFSIDESPPGEMGVIQTGQRMISRVTRHEFISAQAVLGARRDSDDLRSIIGQGYDTAVQFIERVRQKYLNRSQTSAAWIFHLNRATLSLTHTLVVGGGYAFDEGSMNCEISNFTNMVERNREIRDELQKSADEYNARLNREIPDASIGRENQL